MSKIQAMPNPIDPSGALLGAVTICQRSTPPSEAALQRDETSATVNNETKASWAHNFAEESSKEDNNDSIFCEAMTVDPPPPAFLHSRVRPWQATQSIQINQFKKRAAKGQPGDADIMALFYNYYFWLGTVAIAWTVLVQKSYHVIACPCLKKMLLRLLQHMCLHGQKRLHRTASAVYFMAFIAQTQSKLVEWY